MAQENLIESPVIERERLVQLIRKWGGLNADGLLEDSCQIFSIHGVEGFIGYKVESSNAIVFGDPICAPEEKPFYATSFQNFCESQKMNVVYTMASPEFADWASENLSAVSIEFGDKLILNPQNNPLNNKGPKAVLVRKKVKHATKEGITVKEYLDSDPAIERGICEVADSWLKKRRGPQIFLSHVHLFQDRHGKRYFYAQKEGKIIGLLMLNALHEKEGWMLNNTMIAKSTPNGLSELMVMKALQTTAAEGCHYIAIGPLVANQLGNIVGMDKFRATLIRGLFKFLKVIFHLDRQRTFWSKFPYSLEGCYIIFPKNNLGFKSIKAILQAFNVGKD